MSSLLNRQEDECSRLRGFLEDVAATRRDAVSAEEFEELLPAGSRSHFAVCRDCQEAAQDLLAVRQILKTAPRTCVEAGPWFAGRVMAAIAAREKEVEEAARTWLVLPRFAARWAVISGALLLIASTLLYESPSRRQASQPAAPTASEYLFETPQPPANQDDVLISMAERNP
jgi:hypothetical protein